MSGSIKEPTPTFAHNQPELEVLYSIMQGLDWVLIRYNTMGSGGRLWYASGHS